MTNVNRYLRKLRKPANRYWSFNRVCENIIEHDFWITGDWFSCPQCGASNFRDEWDSCDEFLPKCLVCRQIVVEEEEDL